jgi:hypothetical protein
MDEIVSWPPTQTIADTTCTNLTSDHQPSISG